MIKNILYSLFVHFLLFSAIYFAFIKKDNKEIEAEQEIMVSVITIDSKGVPPINEQMQKPEENSKEPQEKAEENEVEKIESPKNEIKKEEPIAPKKIEEPLKKEEETPPKEETKKAAHSKKSNKKEEDKNSAKAMNLKAFKDINEEDQSSTLSTRETINIQSQLKLCYKRALEESGFESKTRIVIKIEISRDGYIENDLEDMIDLEKYNNPVYKDYKIVIDNIERALDLCSPLRNLPIEKYDSWKEIILQFDVGKDSK